MIARAGFTSTVTVKVFPTQPNPDIGVTIYIAFNGALVGLVSIPLI